MRIHLEDHPAFGQLSFLHGDLSPRSISCLKKEKKESLSSLYPSAANFHLSFWVSYERILISTGFWLFGACRETFPPPPQGVAHLHVSQFGCRFNLWPAGAFFPPHELNPPPESQTPKATRYVPASPGLLLTREPSLLRPAPLLKLQLYECRLKKRRGRSSPYSALSFLITTASRQVRSQGW